MSKPDGTQASSYPSPGRKQSKQLIDKKFRQSQPNYHPFDYRESEHSVKASWHKQKETKPSLWQPFSQRRQREWNRENSRVYRLRYGSKSELKGQREEQLDRTRRGISAAPTSRKSYGKVINRTLTQKANQSEYVGLGVWVVLSILASTKSLINKK